MSTETHNFVDINHITEDRIEDEENERIKDATLLYPIGKGFLEEFGQHHDIISSFDEGLEKSIPYVLEHVSVIDKYIPIDETKSVRFKVNWQNVRIYRPDDLNTKKHSNDGFYRTPNEAIVNNKSYTCMLVADTKYSYQIINTAVGGSYEDIYNTNLNESTITEEIIPDSYKINFPIPIGSKFDTLTYYDIGTLIRTGEEADIVKGYFVINGMLKYLINIYRKPFNSPIVLRNNYEDQLSRVEVLYTKTFDYEDSNFIVGAMRLPKHTRAGRGGAHISVPDFGFSLKLEHPKVNQNTTNRKKLINFVPIKFLFAAFGCENDLDMMRCICPNLKDTAMISTIRTAVFQGALHYDAYIKAGIPLKKNTIYNIPEEPITMFTAKYIIGRLILTDECLQHINSISKGKTEDFRIYIVEIVTQILDNCFMPGIGLLSHTPRNEAVCIEIGNIIRKLYLIGIGLEPEQDKASLTNRRIRNSQQLVMEFKSFQRARNREIEERIAPEFYKRKDFSTINQSLHNAMIGMCDKISRDQSASLINAIKGATKEASKVRADYLTPKNAAFVHNLKRQIVISPDIRQQGATVPWEHRTVHPSEMFFICPTQTPEAGRQTGRYKTPTIYTYITLGTSGERVMKVLEQNKNYIKSLTPELMDKFDEIYTIKINGTIVGYTKQYAPVEQLYEDLLAARRDGLIEVDTTISVNHQLSTMSIWNDSGRIVSPFVVLRNVCKISSPDALSGGLLPMLKSSSSPIDSELDLTRDSTSSLEGGNIITDAIAGIKNMFSSTPTPQVWKGIVGGKIYVPFEDIVSATEEFITSSHDKQLAVYNAIRNYIKHAKHGIASSSDNANFDLTGGGLLSNIVSTLYDFATSIFSSNTRTLGGNNSPKDKETHPAPSFIMVDANAVNDKGENIMKLNEKLLKEEGKYIIGVPANVSSETEITYVPGEHLIHHEYHQEELNDLEKRLSEEYAITERLTQELHELEERYKDMLNARESEENKKLDALRKRIQKRKHEINLAIDLYNKIFSGQTHGTYNPDGANAAEKYPAADRGKVFTIIDDRPTSNVDMDNRNYVRPNTFRLNIPYDHPERKPYISTFTLDGNEYGSEVRSSIPNAVLQPPKHIPHLNGGSFDENVRILEDHLNRMHGGSESSRMPVIVTLPPTSETVEHNLDKIAELKEKLEKAESFNEAMRNKISDFSSKISDSQPSYSSKALTDTLNEFQEQLNLHGEDIAIVTKLWNDLMTSASHASDLNGMRIRLGTPTGEPGFINRTFRDITYSTPTIKSISDISITRAEIDDELLHKYLIRLTEDPVNVEIDIYNHSTDDFDSVHANPYAAARTYTVSKADVENYITAHDMNILRYNFSVQPVLRRIEPTGALLHYLNSLNHLHAFLHYMGLSTSRIVAGDPLLPLNDSAKLYRVVLNIDEVAFPNPVTKAAYKHAMWQIAELIRDIQRETHPAPPAALDDAALNINYRNSVVRMRDSMTKVELPDVNDIRTNHVLSIFAPDGMTDNNHVFTLNNAANIDAIITNPAIGERRVPITIGDWKNISMSIRDSIYNVETASQQAYDKLYNYFAGLPHNMDPAHPVHDKEAAYNSLKYISKIVLSDAFALMKAALDPTSWIILHKMHNAASDDAGIGFVANDCISANFHIPKPDRHFDFMLDAHTDDLGLPDFNGLKAALVNSIVRAAVISARNNLGDIRRIVHAFIPEADDIAVIGATDVNNLHSYEEIRDAIANASTVRINGVANAEFTNRVKNDIDGNALVTANNEVRNNAIKNAYKSVVNRFAISLIYSFYLYGYSLKMLIDMANVDGEIHDVAGAINKATARDRMSDVIAIFNIIDQIIVSPTIVSRDSLYNDVLVNAIDIHFPEDQSLQTYAAQVSPAVAGAPNVYDGTLYEVSVLNTNNLNNAIRDFVEFVFRNDKKTGIPITTVEITNNLSKLGILLAASIIRACDSLETRGSTAVDYEGSISLFNKGRFSTRKVLIFDNHIAAQRPYINFNLGHDDNAAIFTTNDGNAFREITGGAPSTIPIMTGGHFGNIIEEIHNTVLSFINIPSSALCRAIESMNYAINNADIENYKIGDKYMDTSLRYLLIRAISETHYESMNRLSLLHNYICNVYHIDTFSTFRWYQTNEFPAPFDSDAPLPAAPLLPGVPPPPPLPGVHPLGCGSDAHGNKDINKGVNIMFSLALFEHIIASLIFYNSNIKDAYLKLFATSVSKIITGDGRVADPWDEQIAVAIDTIIVHPLPGDTAGYQFVSALLHLISPIAIVPILISLYNKAPADAAYDDYKTVLRILIYKQIHDAEDNIEDEYNITDPPTPCGVALKNAWAYMMDSENRYQPADEVMSSPPDAATRGAYAIANADPTVDNLFLDVDALGFSLEHRKVIHAVVDKYLELAEDAAHNQFQQADYISVIDRVPEEFIIHLDSIRRVMNPRHAKPNFITNVLNKVTEESVIEKYKDDTLNVLIAKQSPHTYDFSVMTGGDYGATSSQIIEPKSEDELIRIQSARPRVVEVPVPVHIPGGYDDDKIVSEILTAIQNLSSKIGNSSISDASKEISDLRNRISESSLEHKNDILRELQQVSNIVTAADTASKEEVLDKIKELETRISDMTLNENRIIMYSKGLRAIRKHEYIYVLSTDFAPEPAADKTVYIHAMIPAADGNADDVNDNIDDDGDNGDASATFGVKMEKVDQPVIHYRVLLKDVINIATYANNHILFKFYYGNGASEVDAGIGANWTWSSIYNKTINGNDNNRVCIATDVAPPTLAGGKKQSKVRGGDSNTSSSLVPVKTTIDFNTDFVNWLQDLASHSSNPADADSLYKLGIKKGYIEYLDPEMAITNAVIAGSLPELYKAPHMYTHVALPNHLHGIIISCIPGASLNVGVRATYSTNQVKSAIGPSIRYPQMKYLGENHILCSPHVPLVRPCTYDYLHMGETPFGMNIVIAFIQDEYNQEDSCILNRASVESGLLEIDSMTHYLNENDTRDEEYVVPSEKVYRQGNLASYDKLDPYSALPANVGDLFYTNDVIIGKTRKVKGGTADVSILNEKPDGKYPPTPFPRPLRSVIKNNIQVEFKTSKMVEMGQFRLPIPGDKTNSEHAQKNTVGRIMDVQDIPYTCAGLRPDVIFNGSAMFRRKTYGHAYVAIMAKIAALLNCPIDATNYHTLRSPDELVELLHKLGIDEQCKEIMFNPVTGKKYKSRIFFANHYWERQAHLVENKINVRNGGPRDVSTGQPLSGRRRGGGQSFDRMSMDCMSASGISEIMRSSKLELGSKIRVGYCQRCHNTQCRQQGDTGEWVCPNCGKHPQIIARMIPPAANLITHVLTSAHVGLEYFDNMNVFDTDDQKELLQTTNRFSNK